MKGRSAALAAAPLVLSANVAQAHNVIEGVGGFTGGLLHSLLVPAHALALVALGCLAGTLNSRSRMLVFAAFAAAACISLALVTLAFSAANAELTVLSLAALSGLLMASGWRAPMLITSVLAACIAVTVMFDSVPAVLSVQETLLSLAGTGVAATSIVIAIAFLSAAGPQIWHRIGIRILGSWIAASTLMVLALRLSA